MRRHPTETESYEDTEHEGDEWSQPQGDLWGQNQNATGGEWGQGVGGGARNAGAQNAWEPNQNAAGAWGQNADEVRGQHMGGGWDQGAEGWVGGAWDQGGPNRQEPTNPKSDERKRKSHPMKGGDEWSQGHEISGQKRRQQQGGDAWGQFGQEPQRQAQETWGQHTNHQGGQGGDAWGQGASTRGQDTHPQGGQSGDVWGQGGESQDINNRGGQGGDIWGQDSNRQGQGGDEWGQGASTWDQDTGDNRKLGEWAGGVSSHVAWEDEAQRVPKVTAATATEAVGSRNVLSAQQRSQILSNLLNETQPQNVKGAQPAVKHGAQKKLEHEQWGAWDSRDHGWGSEDEDDTDDTRRVRFSPKASELWGESPRSIPSKTLARIQQGMTTFPVNDPNHARFLESRGAAFEYVTNAFFGNSRLARDRIHWLFPSDKDPRVAAMLAWVQKLSYNLGTFGVRLSTSTFLVHSIDGCQPQLIKFLQNKERGGLFINAIFRMRRNPREPALDWLTFRQVQGTMDKTLQESVAFYDPSAQVMVFVYLPSESGNSIAIWRLKINVPDKTKAKYKAEINEMVKSLPKHTDYIVCVDE